MATQLINDHQNEVHTPSTYRLAGSCSVRAYVACDDTPYHLEQPVTVTAANTNHTPERAAKVREMYAITGRDYRKLSTLVALVDAHPEATTAELLNLLNQ